MKKKIILFFIMVVITLNTKIYGQINLPPVMNSVLQDSLFELYYNFQNKIPEYYNGPKPNDNWKVYTLNSLSVRSSKNLEFVEPIFLKNLFNPLQSYLFIDTFFAVQKDDVFCFPAIEDDDDEFLPATFYHLPQNFINELKFISKRFDLRKISIFTIEPMPELYLFFDNKLYIVKDQKLYLAMPYLKKKYKTIERFLRFFKVYGTR